MKKNIQIAKNLIKQANKIAVFGHMNPDWDCIGAMLGLWRLLEKQKKRVTYVVPNKPSKIFDFIKGIKRLKSNFDYKKYDLLIFLDFTGINRIGIISQVNPNYFEWKTIVVFDHHIDNTIEQGILVKDTKSISTCEILFEQTYRWRPELYDNDIATYFYLGIASDSWNFIFEEDHIRTFSNVVKLLKLGADKDLIVNNLLRKRSFNAIKFLQLLLDRIKEKNGVMYTYYDEDEMKKYAIDQEEAAYGLHIIQHIDWPKLVILIRKIGMQIRCSLRAKKNTSTEKIDCNKIAKTLWWWGHRLAAWFGVPSTGKFEEQIQTIIKYITKQIENSI